MSELGSFKNSTSNSQFSYGCFEIKIGADTAKFTNVRENIRVWIVQIFDQRK